MIGVDLNGYSKHRIEALTDGVYAVAVTLLELKLPESPLAAASSNE